MKAAAESVVHKHWVLFRGSGTSECRHQRKDGVMKPERFGLKEDVQRKNDDSLFAKIHVRTINQPRSPKINTKPPHFLQTTGETKEQRGQVVIEAHLLERNTRTGLLYKQDL